MCGMFLFYMSFQCIFCVEHLVTILTEKLLGQTHNFSAEQYSLAANSLIPDEQNSLAADSQVHAEQNSFVASSAA